MNKSVKLLKVKCNPHISNGHCHHQWPIERALSATPATNAVVTTVIIALLLSVTAIFVTTTATATIASILQHVNKTYAIIYTEAFCDPEDWYVVAAALAASATAVDRFYHYANTLDNSSNYSKAVAAVAVLMPAPTTACSSCIMTGLAACVMLTVPSAPRRPCSAGCSTCSTWQLAALVEARMAAKTMPNVTTLATTANNRNHNNCHSDANDTQRQAQLLPSPPASELQHWRH